MFLRRDYLNFNYSAWNCAYLDNLTNLRRTQISNLYNREYDIAPILILWPSFGERKMVQILKPEVDNIKQA